MLSLYRAWLGPSPCVSRPAPPPGAHRPVPRRAKAPSPQRAATPQPPSPSSTTSSELDVERIEPEEPKNPSNTVLDIASCDGPVRFSRVLNTAWQDSSERNWPCRHRKQRTTLHYYPCKTCGCKFPSYYFVHKHRKRCHGEETPVDLAIETQNLTNEQNEPEPSTSSAAS
ncbi:Uncharacterized protein OBRU01_03150 [Operophtera brumata]|uniref:C2H2-type domain-containing protein n=1 Tax=Operophtera brumata TaxID=104452 RepID=A0A0L7LRG1_OPEBR|nr:Uncharacterized protein OBRU01_03150 [Operophtera brumata]